MELEDKYRLLALKKAAIVLNGLADSFKDESTKAETKSLAWAVSWAVTELETAELKKKNIDDEIKKRKEKLDDLHKRAGII